MCNLYSITTNQAAIIALFRVINRYVGNQPPMPGVFPDCSAPVIRNTDAGIEIVTMRWGMPPPPRMGGAPVTNIRNKSSPHWRMWLKAENRCLKKPVSKGCARSLWGWTTTKSARLLRLGNRTHSAPRYADPEEAAAMFDEPKLIMSEQASVPSRFLVQGGKGWMVYDRQRRGPAMLGTRSRGQT
jgi:hypothetical protein